MPLETEASAEIRTLITDLEPDHADLLEALHRVQRRYGYVPPLAMRLIGEQVGRSEAHIYGVTTFYAELRTTPPPAHTVAWCTGAACRLQNGGGALRAIEAALGCRLDGATEDGRVELSRGQCNGTCELSPQLWLDGRVIGGITAARAVRLGRALRDGADAAAATAAMDGGPDA